MNNPAPDQCAAQKARLLPAARVQLCRPKSSSHHKVRPAPTFKLERIKTRKPAAAARCGGISF